MASGNFYSESFYKKYEIIIECFQSFKFNIMAYWSPLFVLERQSNNNS